jgi:hypothetical protein
LWIFSTLDSLFKGRSTLRHFSTRTNLSM